MSNVRDFGAAGDGQQDDTDSILHALAQGDGVLLFPPGNYLVSRTIRVELDKTGRFGLMGEGGAAKLLMSGSGPAFHLVGTHERTADPTGFEPRVWDRQRLPTVLNLEIEGRHSQASGFLIEGAMQPTFEGVLLRDLEHGIRIHGHARNVLISHCHIYNNRGSGIFLDRVNLHQTIITGSHVSYCLRGGIRIVGSEIRNLQITGNDIEYNYDPEADESADVWIDASDAGASVREGTICGNTIQAKQSPGGANIRIIGRNAEENHRAGMFSISGNLLGSQEINVHLVACRGVVVADNVLYSGHERNLLVDGSRNIVIGPNCFDHNPDYGDRELCTGVRLVDSHDCTFTGSIVHDCQAGRHTVAGAAPRRREGLLEIIRCRRVNVCGCQLLDGQPYGMYVEDSDHVSLTSTTVCETRDEHQSRAAVRWRGAGRGNFVCANTFGRGVDDVLVIDDAAGVRLGDNLME
jgi:hypothetical protein